MTVHWVPVALTVAIIAGLLAYAFSRGDKADRVVRCSEGHLFTTIWVPFISVKAIRLGGNRYQYCPVGRHWTTVEIIDDLDALSQSQRNQAKAVHDIRIP